MLVNKKQIAKLIEKIEQQEKITEEIIINLKTIIKDKEVITNYIDLIEKDISSLFDTNNLRTKEIDTINSNIQNLKGVIHEIRLNARESLWADIFHDTVVDSNWLIKKNFSLGRAAIGYNFAYVLYRILDEIHPKNILELGLGQSTHMIVQYIKYAGEKHICVEQDEQWEIFWKNNHELPIGSKLMVMSTIEKQYKGDNVLIYSDFEQLKKEKFDLILIDGPLQLDSNNYRRIDILSILPSCLMEKWCIIFDDFNRIQEKNTVYDVKDCLINMNIEFCEGIYKGKKDIFVLASKDLKYITTL